MADTPRVLTDLQALLPDNASGQISPQDVRDFLVSAVPSGRAATKVVAASDASALIQAQADYLCDGTADDVQIQAAIDALGSGGGTVVLSAGTFSITTGVVITSTVAERSVRVSGQGRYSTVINVAAGLKAFKFGNRATSGNATIGSGLAHLQLQCSGATGDGTSIGLDTDGIELCQFEDLLIEDFDSGVVLRNLDRCVMQTIRVGNPKLYGYKLVQAGTSVGGHNNWGTANFINCEWVLSENNSVGCIAIIEGNGSNPLARITWQGSMLYASTTPTGTRGFYVSTVGIVAASFYNVIFENNLVQVETDSEAHLSFFGCEFLRSGSDSTRILKADAFGTFSFYDCAFQRATIAFETTAGSPRIAFYGGNKNDGNIGTVISGSWGARLGTDMNFAGTDALALGTSTGNRMDYVFANHVVPADLRLTDGITAPGTDAGFAVIYVDTADGDLKVKFGDGVTKTLATDT